MCGTADTGISNPRCRGATTPSGAPRGTLLERRTCGLSHIKIGEGSKSLNEGQKYSFPRLSLRATCIQSKTNGQANSLKHCQLNVGEWGLNQQVFRLHRDDSFHKRTCLQLSPTANQILFLSSAPTGLQNMDLHRLGL